MINENLSGYDSKKVRSRIRNKLRRLHGDDTLSGFADIFKGVIRGVKGGVSAGKEANKVPAKAPVKTTTKKTTKQKINPIMIVGIAGAGILIFVLTKKKRKGKK